MTQEDKQLLLKDLCARLPYGVICEFSKDKISVTAKLGLGGLEEFICGTEVKPYLRPMSNMTDEEVKEIRKINWQFCKPKNNLDECFVGDADDGYCSVSQMADILEYLNKHHFDYRRLIEKGLAIEAPKDMYKFD